MDKSIYKSILDNIDRGRLREGYSLPQDEPEEGADFGFADGAMDGIMLYHLGPQNLSSAGAKLMIRAIRTCANGCISDADEMFAELGKTYRAVGLADEVQMYILENKKRFAPDDLYEAASSIMLNSKHVESVKFAMEILELMVIKDETYSAVRRLGLCEEFTLCAIWLLAGRDNGNEEIFQLAQKVKGWGRIHAVDRLEPSTKEISDWLLHHGIDNEVAPAYSALTVWNKTDAANRLKGRLTEDEFHSISRLFSALTDETLKTGLSGVDDPEEAIKDYLNLAQKFDLTLEDYQAIDDLGVWTTDYGSEMDPLSDVCADLLSTEEFLKLITEAVRHGDGLELARLNGIDYKESFFECLKADFEGQFAKIGFLTCFEEYLEPVMELFRAYLPREFFSAKPDRRKLKDLPSIEFYKLNVINRQLCQYPGEGQDLLAAGLKSPDLTCRVTAVRSLSDWTVKMHEPLWDIAPPMYSRLKDAYESETDEGVKEMMQGVLDGIIPAEAEGDEPEDE